MKLLTTALLGATQRLRALPAKLVNYLGDAAHRRFTAVAVALIATHFLGKELNAGELALGMEIVIGGIGGAWVKPAPKEGQ
ncbi:hypothetical protein KRZ98_18355 [Sphingobium sp. AS12]|uniref:hypothetical protein n=1 Tax=Sphingobium sp. AS12 TaxID=2849495 RepID=UPI001C316583|nr:hypothetical protein [Sphingobium sp. AS12]MBV2150201.1 hypothetical protein [Sphingobium sp. AS12]